MNSATQETIEQLKRFEITCPNCGKRAPLSRCGFVQTYWYERPHGCTEGDNWWPNEEIEDCLIVCPHSCAGDDPGNPRNFAVRFRDLSLGRAESKQVFGLIKLITKRREEQLTLIFSEYYLQYGEKGEIKSRADLNAEKDSAYDLI